MPAHGHREPGPPCSAPAGPFRSRFDLHQANKTISRLIQFGRRVLSSPSNMKSRRRDGGKSVSGEEKSAGTATPATRHLKYFLYARVFQPASPPKGKKKITRKLSPSMVHRYPPSPRPEIKGRVACRWSARVMGCIPSGTGGCHTISSIQYESVSAPFCSHIRFVTNRRALQFAEEGRDWAPTIGCCSIRESSDTLGPSYPCKPQLAARTLVTESRTWDRVGDNRMIQALMRK